MNSARKMTNGETLTTGAAGTGAAAAAWWVSHLPTINANMQFLVLCGGAVVSFLTARKLLRKKNK